jgi:hypothetical protein
MTMNNTASASLISGLDFNAPFSIKVNEPYHASSHMPTPLQRNQMTDPHGPFHEVGHLPPPPIQPPPEPPRTTMDHSITWSSMIPPNVDSLSPDQRSQYLQQLLAMNQQIINMMSAEKNK